MSTLPTITLLYAGILSLMAIVLGFGAGSTRGKAGISIGDGGITELHVAIRRHGNFIEWVPMILITLALLEMHGISAIALHSLGAGLVFARILHAVGLNAVTIQSIPRLVGAFGTIIVMAVAAIWAIVIFF